MAAKKVVKKSAVKAPVVYGIKETKDVLLLAFGLVKAFKTAKENDGALNIADLQLLVNLFPQIKDAIVDIKLVVKEMKDIDSEETKELLTFSAAHLAGNFTDNEDLVNKIEQSLKLAIEIVNTIKMFLK